MKPSDWSWYEDILGFGKEPAWSGVEDLWGLEGSALHATASNEMAAEIIIVRLRNLYIDLEVS